MKSFLHLLKQYRENFQAHFVLQEQEGKKKKKQYQILNMTDMLKSLNICTGEFKKWSY